MLIPLSAKSWTAFRNSATKRMFPSPNSRDLASADLRLCWWTRRMLSRLRACAERCTARSGSSRGDRWRKRIWWLSDAGFDGVVLRFRGANMDFAGHSLKVEAGAVLQDVVDSIVARGLKGMETMTGIPGYLGAAATVMPERMVIPFRNASSGCISRTADDTPPEQPRM